MFYLIEFKFHYITLLMKFCTKNLRTYLSLNELHVGVLNSFVSKIQKFRIFFFFGLKL